MLMKSVENEQSWSLNLSSLMLYLHFMVFFSILLEITVSTEVAMLPRD
jgi:hypothetical protein